MPVSLTAVRVPRILSRAFKKLFRRGVGLQTSPDGRVGPGHEKARIPAPGTGKGAVAGGRPALALPLQTRSWWLCLSEPSFLYVSMGVRDLLWGIFHGLCLPRLQPGGKRELHRGQ